MGGFYILGNALGLGQVEVRGQEGLKPGRSDLALNSCQGSFF